ncbi:hypothetical protein BC939DRAFT_437922 [Gamsiella multidivaricata]|uniref:uncharacterized protein n=1 Tax=Gamsiella multidivaricata TaxID=101098 RepID=UPI00221F1045|nr:uncharacterized protein BC939DRAFT_437922 [Gamsiella multidivaricata]KAG0352130.1 hypothetical protein BGZ54_002954 [Gamsiella multidivaricata]KAI7831205.1 hypothetical protein BC939DRAFT_437922 [Gamsiella multidivaricata]
MVQLTPPSQKTVIISISAVLGIATVASLYLYLRDSKQRPASNTKFRSLQRSLYSQLLKAQDSLDDIIESDLRRIQVRTKTLRTHRLYPGDESVQLPSLGLINEQDKSDLGAEIEETKEELIHERTQGFEDHAKVRQGYKELDLLVKALHKQLLRLLERVEKVSLSELAEIGDETGGISQENESEIQAIEKIRRRRRSVLAKIQKFIAQLDAIRNSYKERLQQIKEFEKMERIGLEPSDDVEPTVESEMMKEGITFADITALNIEEPEILAPTEDLERMKQGISFAAVVAENLPEEKEDTAEQKSKQGVSFADKVETIEPSNKIETIERSNKAETIERSKKVETIERSNKVKTIERSDKVETIEPSDKDLEVLAPTEDLEKMKHGISFADVVAENIEEPVKETEEQEILAPTEDLEKMKQGISFADVVAENIEEPTTEDGEVLAPTEDLEKMKQGISFADMAKHNLDDSSDKEAEVLAPTEDLEKMKQGVSFADVVAED